MSRSQRQGLRQGGFPEQERQLRLAKKLIEEVREFFDANAGVAPGTTHEFDYDDGGLWEVLALAERLINHELPQPPEKAAPA